MENRNKPKDGQIFFSKRNKVSYDASLDCVRKEFTQANDYRREKRVYGLLAADDHLPVPQVMSMNDDKQELILEFLEDTTLLTAMTEDEKKEDVEGAVSKMRNLFGWLGRFHGLTGGKLVLYDVNFRNFIFHKGALYGIDFESVREGDIKKEYSKVLAMYLMYDPTETDFKEEVCRRVVDDLDMPQDTWTSIGACIREIRDRRRNH